MIKEPTVFILGAGASQPYGFPIGEELKREILKHLRKDKGREFKSAGFSEDEIELFMSALGASPYDTIDELLTYRPSLAIIGKFAIGLILTKRQLHMNVFSPRNDNWYKFLFSKLELSRADMPPLTIMTFNYDVSLEYYFENCIDVAFEGDARDVAKNNYK